MLFLDPYDQHHGSDSHQQVSSPDQPVQVSHQDQHLCHPESRDQERVDDASRAQQPVSAGPHGHHPKDEQAEGANDAKPLVNVRKTDLDQENQKPAPHPWLSKFSLV